MTTSCPDPIPPEIRQLLQDYLAGELPAEGLERLEAFLKADPVSRENVVRLLAQHELLAEFYRQEASGNAQGFVRATIQLVEARSRKPRSSESLASAMEAIRRAERSPRRSRLYRPLRFVPLAVAASLLAVAGVWWRMDRSPSREIGTQAIALVAEKVSGVRCQDPRGFWRKLAAGDTVRAGAKIETTGNGSVKLTYVSDGATIEVGGNSKLELGPSPAAPAKAGLPAGAILDFGAPGIGARKAGLPARMILERGRLQATVEKQEPGKLFVVETPHAWIAVKGTRFSVLVQGETGSVPGRDSFFDLLPPPHSGQTAIEAARFAVPRFVGSTWVRVEEGVVNLRRKTSVEGPSVDVSVREFAVAGGEGWPYGTPDDGEQDGPLLFQDDFANGLEKWRMAAVDWVGPGGLLKGSGERDQQVRVVSDASRSPGSHVLEMDGRSWDRVLTVGPTDAITAEDFVVEFDFLLAERYTVGDSLTKAFGLHAGRVWGPVLVGSSADRAEAAKVVMDDALLGSESILGKWRHVRAEYRSRLDGAGAPCRELRFFVDGQLQIHAWVRAHGDRLQWSCSRSRVRIGPVTVRQLTGKRGVTAASSQGESRLRSGLRSAKFSAGGGGGL